MKADIDFLDACEYGECPFEPNCQIANIDRGEKWKRDKSTKCKNLGCRKKQKIGVPLNKAPIIQRKNVKIGVPILTSTIIRPKNSY